MADATVFNDFSDRLSPMLVKELRQGMRARTFVAVFLALQVFLLLILLISFSAAGASNQDAGATLSGIVFLFYSIAVLVVQPLRGMGALSSEIKGNTIDMMVLTRLDSWRIVAGKWSAIVAQSALILVATMPYLVLRYFFGGMNLFAELNLLALIFVLSCGLTALTVGLSSSGAVISRLIPIAGTPFLIFTIFTFLDARQMKRLLENASLATDTQRYTVLAALLLISYLAWLALSVGASQIAPIAENHATRRRLIGLGAVLAVGVVGWLANFKEFAFVTSLLIAAGPLIIATLGEGQQLIPRHCQPFVKRGLPGRIAGRFLYPGWVSGVPFVTLLIACLTGIFGLYHLKHTLDNETVLTITALIGSLVFPRVLMIGWSHKVRQVLPTYLLIGTGSGLASVILYAMAESTNTDGLLAIFSWLPAVALFWGNGHYSARETAGWVAAASLAIYLLALLVTSFAHFKKVRQLEIDAGV